MRAVIYARVSTTKQAAQDLSIPDQIQRCEQYCEQRGWTVAKQFIDSGVSATTDNRPEFQAMIAEACSQARPFDVLLVHSQSRFARNTLDLLHYRRKLEKGGVQLISITQDIGTGDQANVLVTMLAAMDEYQSAEISKHVSRSMIENAKQGFWNGAIPPYGYKTYTADVRGAKKKKKLEIAPDEAENIRFIFKLYVHGDGDTGPLGIRRLQKKLNTDGILYRKERPFRVQQIQRILRNEAYIGNHYLNKRSSKNNYQYRPREEWIHFSVPPIISDDLFHAAQKKLDRQNPLKTAPRMVTSNVLLTGLAHCSACNSKLRMATGKSGAYKYYKCSTRLEEGNDICPGCSVRAEKLDDIVINALLERAFDHDGLLDLWASVADRATNMATELEARVEALKSEKAAIRSKLEILWEQISVSEAKLDDAGKALLAKLQRQQGRLAASINELEARRLSDPKPIRPEDFRHFSNVLKKRLNNQTNPQFVRALIRTHIVGVGVDGQRQRVRVKGSNEVLLNQISHFAESRDVVPSLVQEWWA